MIQVFKFYSPFLFIILICNVDCIKYLNKRNQQVPQLTLDVIPHQGVAPSSGIDESTPDYYFPVDSGLLNFTCTIKHPQQRYRMRIIKEQLPLTELELIDSGDYVLNTKIKDSERYILEYTEGIIDGSSYLRVSLLIKQLKLSDNGVYRCFYYKTSKQVNAIVYKKLLSRDIVFPTSSRRHGYEIDQEHSFACRANDMYPKPNITFSHSDSSVDLKPFYHEKDLTIVPNNNDDNYYMHTIVSTLNYTLKYTDHLKILACRVCGAANSSETKTITLHVNGIQFIDNLCKTEQGTKANQPDFKITCRFFANPKVETTWETTLESPSVAETVTESDTSNELSEETTPTPLNILTITEDSTNDEYSQKTEELGEGLYETVLTINLVKDFKVFTIKLRNDHKELSRNIRMVTENQLRSQQENSASKFKRVLLHSILFTILIIFLID